MTTGNSALKDILVLDTASYVAAPAAATIMADYGADVIKVEPPSGDPMRKFGELRGMPKSPENYPWHFISRGKRSIVLNLEDDTDWKALATLASRADVFITNAPSRVAGKLRITKEHICPLNDQLVYARISGFGEKGPEADKPGYDVAGFWARSGLQDWVRDPQAPPALPAPAMGDLPSGAALFGAIMLALFNRQNTGKASPVDVSLLGMGLWANALLAQAALAQAEFLERLSNRDRRHPLVGDVKTADGKWIKLTLIRPGEDEWQRLLKVIDREDLSLDGRFVDTNARTQNASTLIEILDEVFARETAEIWEARLTEQHIPFSLMTRTQDLHADEHVRAAGIVVPSQEEDKTAQETIAVPLNLAEAPPRISGSAPELDEHGDAICAEFGLTRSKY